MPKIVNLGPGPDSGRDTIVVAYPSVSANVGAVLKSIVSSPTRDTVFTTDSKEPAEKGRVPGPATSHFKMVFLCVFGFIVVCGIASGVMAGIWTTPTNAQGNVMASFDFAWKAGVGTLLGLLGGKVA